MIAEFVQIYLFKEASHANIIQNIKAITTTTAATTRYHYKYHSKHSKY